MKRLYLLFLTVLLTVLFLVNPRSSNAAGSFSLSPGTKSVPQGANFTVIVRVNTGGDPVNAVQANLSYPVDKLDFIGVSASGSAFEIQAEGSGGGGAVRLGRGTVSTKNGNLTVGNVTFRAKANSGSATVNFAGGSAVVRSTDNANIFSGGGGGTYSFGQPSAQSTPTPAPDSGPQGPINITDVKVEDLGLSSASISWKTAIPATSLVEYGLSEKLGITVSDLTLTTNHKLSLESKFISPGTIYYFQIKSKNEADEESSGKVENFKTKGYKVLIKVENSRGQPLKSQKILLFNDYPESSTNNRGIVEFNDVSIGTHSVHIKVGGRTFGDEIDVKETVSEVPQEFTVRVADGFDFNLIKSALFLIPGLFLIIIVVILIWKFKFRRKIDSGNPNQA